MSGNSSYRVQESHGRPGAYLLVCCGHQAKNNFKIWAKAKTAFYTLAHEFKSEQNALHAQGSIEFFHIFGIGNFNRTQGLQVWGHELTFEKNEASHF